MYKIEKLNVRAEEENIDHVLRTCCLLFFVFVFFVVVFLCSQCLCTQKIGEEALEI